MKLATSTGDYAEYVDSVVGRVREFKGSKFKNINLELSGSLTELFTPNDDWKRLAGELAEAASCAGIRYVVAHAPCLNVFQNDSEEGYRADVDAIRRSLEVCHVLGIDRIVVHACPKKEFTVEEFWAKNKAFYSEFFDLMEKYNIMVLTENWDNPDTHLSTGEEIRAFLDYVNHPLLAACWDTAHGNIDPKARAIGQYPNIIAIGDKLKGMHISDNFGDVHHHTWPFAGIINFDAVTQGLLDVNYDGYFTFEASYTLLHRRNLPYHRKLWIRDGEPVTKLLSPSIELKKKAVDLLYETGKYILETYDCFEE